MALVWLWYGLSIWIFGLLDVGLLDFWMLECWNVGMLDVGMLDCWIVGLLDCWIVGMLDFWIFGLLECWIVGLVVVSLAPKGGMTLLIPSKIFLLIDYIFELMVGAEGSLILNSVWWFLM